MGRPPPNRRCAGKPVLPENAQRPVTQLVLKHASASRPSGEWNGMMITTVLAAVADEIAGKGRDCHKRAPGGASGPARFYQNWAPSRTPADRERGAAGGVVSGALSLTRVGEQGGVPCNKGCTGWTTTPWHSQCS
jgi:hypothetical protein